jgi:transposase
MTQNPQAVIRSVGVDVSKAELEVAELDGNGHLLRRTLANRVDVVRPYVQSLVDRGFRGPVLVESTGHWQWILVLAARAVGLQVYLLNPLLVAKHRAGRVRRCKTDRRDAEILAEMGVTEVTLPLPFMDSPQRLHLRFMAHLRQKLDRVRQMLQGSTRGYATGCAQIGLDPAEVGLEALLQQLDQVRQALEQRIAAAAREQADPAAVMAVDQLPGVSAELAATLAAVLDRTRSSRAAVAYVGLDVSVHQSGPRQRRGHLTKRGQAFLRQRLFHAAWGAMLHNPHAKAYYRYLRASGRAYVEALIIIARKLLRAAHALIQNPRQTVQPERLFTVPS